MIDTRSDKVIKEKCCNSVFTQVVRDSLLRFFLDLERVVCLLNVPGLLKDFAQEFWSWNLFKELIHSDILLVPRPGNLSKENTHGLRQVCQRREMTDLKRKVRVYADHKGYVT